MKSLIFLLSMLALGSCDSADKGEQLVFADGSEFNKEKFKEGMMKGCETKSVESVPFFDRKTYCDCLANYVLENSSKITLDAKSTDEEEVSVDLVSHFEFGEGASKVAECRLAAIDESKFDWAAEETRFREAMATKDSTLAKSTKYPAYLECVWSKVKDSVAVGELIDPMFGKSAKLTGYTKGCAETAGLKLSE